MAKRRTPTNPFYVLLVITGTLFAVTACAYGVMAFRAVVPGEREQASESGLKFMQIIDQYGGRIMLGEIVVLTIATAGAMLTDNYWTKRGGPNA